MRWQALACILAVALLAVAPASATVIDFATDPNLATEWTRYDYYGQSGASYTQVWNQSSQRLDLASAAAEANVGLYKNGTSRSDNEGVTLTLSDFVEGGAWLAAGLIVSQQRAPGIFDATPSYGIFYNYDSTGSRFYGVSRSSSGGSVTLAKSFLASAPTSVKFDITRDGADYVFWANGDEVCRDSALSSTSLPNYMMFWGTAGAATLSVSADNFGVVPEPSTFILAATGFFGLLCYAWRKRK